MMIMIIMISHCITPHGSTWGESFFVLLQSLIVSLLTLHYQNKGGLAAGYIVLVAGLAYAFNDCASIDMSTTFAHPQTRASPAA